MIGHSSICGIGGSFVHGDIKKEEVMMLELAVMVMSGLTIVVFLVVVVVAA